ncbi:3-dehydroquinate synthase [Candidatus Roizmanbacteria bacterium CG_4_9_14_0_2_um_filter_39_13]|uniref:3-dehydroquinate synthase n=2 Tax=Candidatus Roizmaniibacteriota TaxID=1752723 RepID=A0A2M8EWC4_9BACT|nr:MAG: 3-dehydroquinate synthase [Candidatus Roizmanbacteria bacterium CG_4_10_14_0_2_um_filter_39_12]PJC30163.1 MAG: 3-dehydroquinate synthase [Candidatus Roizmanbacteria bacterium CG_4_9_14_0_2_um_filter_39_13]PJE61795.1 MAG: 3-dehydroquinate synthase [Candidatus Roizmanbacteria bacterium CG10_big_fil_rev_8_21_14_0_10_39_12]
MKTINISIQHISKKYSVFIGEKLIATLSNLISLNSYSQAYVITDSTVAPHYLEPVTKALQESFSNEKIHSYIFDAGEKSKQLSTVENIYQNMAEKNLDRKSVVINLGGGVVTDLGGFAASTYLRGLPFINISTTLEGMVDASVGGKTGANLGTMKNYVGTFSQPKAVITDVSTLHTLPHRTLIQGYAEVLKHGLIADKKYFEEVSEKPFSEFNSKKQIDIIARSVEIKVDIVRQDEYESSTRKLLNFGHTIGHVLESLSFSSSNPLYHGEAVAIGMVAEAKIAALSGMISDTDFNKIASAIQIVGLPIKYTAKTSVDEIYSLLSTDKKNSGGKIKWTLLSAIGAGEENVEIGESFVRKAIAYIL